MTQDTEDKGKARCGVPTSKADPHEQADRHGHDLPGGRVAEDHLHEAIPHNNIAQRPVAEQRCAVTPHRTRKGRASEPPRGREEEEGR